MQQEVNEISSGVCEDATCTHTFTHTQALVAVSCLPLCTQSLAAGHTFTCHLQSAQVKLKKPLNDLPAARSIEVLFGIQLHVKLFHANICTKLFER